MRQEERQIKSEHQISLSQSFAYTSKLTIKHLLPFVITQYWTISAGFFPSQSLLFLLLPVDVGM